MALKYMVKTLDGIEENLHALYTKGDIGYTLDVEGIKDTKGLESALTTERDLNKKGKAKISALEKLRDDAETKTLEEQGKFKDLFESQKTQTLQSQKDLLDLQTEVGNGRRDALVKDFALNMSTDKDEIDVISRFAGDFVTVEGKEASFSKPIEELRTELSRFVRSKANGSNDGGNNNSGGSKGRMDGSKSERTSSIQAMLDENK